jgi:hypothetical protein
MVASVSGLEMHLKLAPKILSIGGVPVTASAIFDCGAPLWQRIRSSPEDNICSFLSLIRANPNRPTVEHGTKDGSTGPKNIHKLLFSIEVSHFLF